MAFKKNQPRTKASIAKQQATAAENRRAKQQAFLAVFAHVGTVTEACRLQGILRQTHYNWMADDPDYPTMFKEAKEMFADSLRYEATRRGRDGVRSYKFYQGKPILDPVTQEPYYENVWSDQLLLAQLKANVPEEYSEKHMVTHEGSGDLMNMPIGPGEPEEAFHALMQQLERMHVNEVKITKVTTLSIAERAAAIKARRSQNGSAEHE